MLISRTWLQSYTKTELPNTQDIAQHLMLHAFEIEGVVNDDLIDIDVLPNRAHDCLCHQGIAQELLGILKIDHVDTRYPENTIKASTDAPTIRVENTESCRRYTAYFMNNVKVEASPVWLRESLESINQKSINNTWHNPLAWW
mgnify:FL=1